MRPARAIALATLRRQRSGRIELIEGGRRSVLGPAEAELRVRLKVHDPATWWRLRHGSVGLAEGYMAGEWDCDDLVSLVRIAARELPRLEWPRRTVLPLRRLLERVPRNTVERSRQHISAHYDLGNELFATFLDETMTYSCAAFDSPQMSLREAQLAKLERICRKLELGPSDHLLEIGTGWGSLAIHAAANHGCRVTTTTISREQRALAQRRVAEAGVADRVTILLEDYRHLRGRFDKLASIEMIEAVGWQYFDAFFARCRQLIEPGGLALLQAITIDHRDYELEKATRSFVKKYVFPSGCLPSVEVMRRSASRAGLREVALEDMTASYPLTLSSWRRNFIAAREKVAELGYDDRFRRLWELYLSWSEGGFRERKIADCQMLLAGPLRGARSGEGRGLSLAARG